MLSLAYLNGQDPLKKRKDLEEEGTASLEIRPKECRQKPTSPKDQKTLIRGD